LRPHGSGARLSIDDDGVGFDVQQAQTRGQGLRNIALRARELGAHLDIRSSPERGTEIVLDIPSQSGHETGPVAHRPQGP
jgi:signal transduction histidine kinase